jgi:mannitol-1-phosphate/altronate dehydrogenase
LIDEAMSDPLIERTMRALMNRETGPTLSPVPGVNLESYKEELIARFANSAIRDTVERVDADASINLLLDPIRDRLNADEPIDLRALGLAAWLRRVRGEDERGLQVRVYHPLAALLRERAIAGGADPLPLLSLKELFGDLGADARFTRAVAFWLSELYKTGALGTLQRAARLRLI